MELSRTICPPGLDTEAKCKAACLSTHHPRLCRGITWRTTAWPALPGAASPLFAPPLCSSNCTMVEVKGEGAYYLGSFDSTAGAGVTTAAACNSLCLRTPWCAGVTFSIRPGTECVLYRSLEATKSTSPRTTGLVKCAAGSTDATTCGCFAPSPPPPSPPAHFPGITRLPVGPIDPTGKQAGEYFSRIIAWYTKGGFTDELGVHHRSGHHFRWTNWEVLNEIDEGSPMLCPDLHAPGTKAENFTECARRYTLFYDGVVSTIQREHADLNLEYHGVALALPLVTGSEVFWTYFLDRRNHQPDIPLDYISYHWYGSGPGANPKSWQPFAQADALLEEAAKIQAIVNRLSPDTKVNVDEIGSIGGCNFGNVTEHGDERWFENAIGAVFAYTYAKLAQLGVEIMAASQLMAWGSPSVSDRQIWPAGKGPYGSLDQKDFPCVTMLNWADGTGTARFWVLKLLIDGLGGADTQKTLLRTNITVAAPSPGATVPAESVFAQAFAVRPSGRPMAQPSKVLLLVNKMNSTVNVSVDGAAGKRTSWVDDLSGHSMVPYASAIVPSDGSIQLRGYAVELIHL